jgi:hypothetical protein
MKVLFGSMITDARGRLGGHVMKKTAFGNSVSLLALPRNRFLWQQNSSLARNSYIMRAWNELDDNQKEQYKIFASENPLPNSFAVLRNIGSRAMFVKLVQALEFPNIDYPDPYSLSNVIPPTLVTAVGYSTDTGFVRITVGALAQPVQAMCWVQRISSQHQSPKNNIWRRIPNIPLATVGFNSGSFDIRTLVGEPIAGTRYWLRFAFVNESGWSSGRQVNLLFPFNP